MLSDTTTISSSGGTTLTVFVVILFEQVHQPTKYIALHPIQ